MQVFRDKNLHNCKNIFSPLGFQHVTKGNRQSRKHITTRKAGGFSRQNKQCLIAPLVVTKVTAMAAFANILADLFLPIF